MTHVFVAPHPDDAALACGGLIASLRELGQNVAIITVFSGAEASGLRREALGFGSKAVWPVTEAFNHANVAADYPVYGDPDLAPPWAATTDRLDATQADADAAAKRFWQRSSWYRRASIHNESLAGQVVIDDLPTQGAVLTDELTDAAAAGDSAAARRIQDERFAAFAETSIVFLDLPDAPARGYAGEAELLGPARADDAIPYEAIRREITRLEPQRVYVPLGIGGHVDHRLAREVGLRLLGESRSWVMPGPEFAGKLAFYEDFPYAWWSDFNQLADLGPTALAGLPADIGLVPEYADVGDQIERKITGISLYATVLEPLFGGRAEMAQAVRGHGREVAALGGAAGFAERYWTTRRA
jgi:LmbE family N-acetylglucosaminyl deacetylase